MAGGGDLRPGKPMPIDGMWRIDSVGARVRIEGGRIFALDPWVHLFIWQILPGRSDQPDTIYAGIQPASLFESHRTAAIETV